MQVTYQRVHTSSGLVMYKLARVEPCCTNLADAVSRRIVFWGDSPDEDQRRQLRKQVCIAYIEDPRDTFDVMAISFCPFCGVAVRFENVGDIDLVEREVVSTKRETVEVERDLFNRSGPGVP